MTSKLIRAMSSASFYLLAITSLYSALYLSTTCLAISEVDPALAKKCVKGKKIKGKKPFHLWPVIDFFSCKSMEPEFPLLPTSIRNSFVRVLRLHIGRDFN